MINISFSAKLEKYVINAYFTSLLEKKTEQTCNFTLLSDNLIVWLVKNSSDRYNNQNLAVIHQILVSKKNTVRKWLKCDYKNTKKTKMTYKFLMSLLQN